MKGAISLFAVVMVGLCAEDPDPRSVCDVLGNIEQFSCARVRIRARLAAGGDVVLEPLTPCKTVLNVEGEVFSNVIALSSAGDPVVGCGMAAADGRHARQAFRKILDEYDYQRQSVIVILEGFIQTRTPARTGLVGRSPVRKLGFGHLGQCPAQLIYTQIVAVEGAPVKK